MVRWLQTTKTGLSHYKKILNGLQDQDFVNWVRSRCWLQFKEIFIPNQSFQFFINYKRATMQNYWAFRWFVSLVRTILQNSLFQNWLFRKSTCQYCAIHVIFSDIMILVIGSKLIMFLYLFSVLRFACVRNISKFSRDGSNNILWYRYETFKFRLQDQVLSLDIWIHPYILLSIEKLCWKYCFTRRHEKIT